jgi:hypothetical protein
MVIEEHKTKEVFLVNQVYKEEASSSVGQMPRV